LAQLVIEGQKEEEEGELGGEPLQQPYWLVCSQTLGSWREVGLWMEVVNLFRKKKSMSLVLLKLAYEAGWIS
jgi:hypothetical protein